MTIMDYRARLLDYLRQERDHIAYRIDIFSSGEAQFRELRSGVFEDATGDVLVRLHHQLGEVGALIHETEVAPKL
jgi:hypothetical protein